MLMKLKKVTYLLEYKLKIVFSNGKTKVCDFESWIFEDNVYLKPLRDIEFFKKVHLDESKYTIYWPNGADFCPDVLYKTGRAVRKTSRKSPRAKCL